MKNNSENYALITGATSGIGLEFARIFAREGHNMVLVARSENELQQITDDLCNRYNISVIPVAKDLFDPQAPQQIYDEVKSKGLTVDVLINDAGQGEYGFFAETDIRRELDIIQLNITSLVYLTKLFLKDMLAANNGKILNVASIAGRMPAPLLSVYAATKAFVYSFSQSVINELKDTNVTMTALLPGATETDFFNKAGMENTKEWKENPLADAAQVAKDGYDALMSGDAKVISGLKNKFMVAMANVTPDQALAENMRQMHMKNVDGSEGKAGAKGKDAEGGNTIDLRGKESMRKAAGNPKPGAEGGRTDGDPNARTSGRQFSSSSFNDEDNPDRL